MSKTKPSLSFALSEGVYDQEPHNVRAVLYLDFFGKHPMAIFEIHDLLIDHTAIKKWIDDKGFKLVHTKLNLYDDGENREAQYFINTETKSMVCISRKCYKAGKTPTDTAIDVEDFVHGRNPSPNNNPNKFNFLCFLGSTEKAAREFQEVTEKNRIEEDPKNKLYLLKAGDFGGLELDSFPMQGQGTDLELNYGKAFMPTHEKILHCLTEKKSGLYVFHGPPGTGKTSYIKYLTTITDHKKFIFVPNTTVGSIFSPKMVDKLYTFKKSVLVLEDAEMCVFKRDSSNNELVSGILNITDGLLKELLDISIIVTFNSADIKELDKALLRKGRLHVMHEFGLLNLDDAKKLAENLGKKNAVTKPLSLADVYNLDEETGLEESESKVVGFGFGK